ncbi:MAG TPA: methyltransferase domain-containing protein [Actinomycetota bacterium]|jgi:SAM-dependent methyltransferase|nr:methyltransferase domain-containing protein [Actinomycetota bacterium]HEV3494788.1 methyltransferase domain-containing protein [Actinomycetes bacterium]
MTERRYALQLDPGEVERYRMMAAQARADEADLWELAGIGPAASVADVGCGPGAILPALSDAVGPGGRVKAVDADPEAVAAASALVAAAGLGNVSVARGRADHTGLEPGSLTWSCCATCSPTTAAARTRSSPTWPPWSARAAACTWSTSTGRQSGACPSTPT